jgi:hypothetical protein
MPVHYPHPQAFAQEKAEADSPGFGIAITILTILGALKFIRRK